MLVVSRLRTIVFGFSVFAAIAAVGATFLVTRGAATTEATVPLAIDTVGTPVLELDSDFVDFGDVPVSQMVEATFTVTNTGDATLLFAEEPFVELKDGC